MRIRGALKALNYHPDQIARSLKTGRTHTIGVVIPDITNPFYPSVFRGIEAAARTAGYSLLLGNSNESAEQERVELETLVSRRVDGILLACSSGSRFSNEPAFGRVPVVFVDRIPDDVRAAAICTDNPKAAQIATRHLVGLGHRRIALLAGDTTLSPHAERLEGFRQAMRRSKLQVSKEFICTGGVQVEEGQEAAARLLTCRMPPTAIIASNGKLLLGLLRAIREQRMVVPRDLSILAFDESEWAEYIDPPITSMAQYAYDMGQRAFELLETAIAGTVRMRQPRITRLSATLQLRGSTGVPPS